MAPNCSLTVASHRSDLKLSDAINFADDSQGVPLAMLQDLVRYWQAD
jgi:hypothetical protein